MATSMMFGRLNAHRPGRAPYFPRLAAGRGAKARPACRDPESQLAHPEQQWEARDAKLVALLPLVKQTALKIRAHLLPHVELDDLIGDGVLGLLDAVDKFDVSKHVKLACYARHRIRGAILDGLRKLDHASREARKKSRKVERIHQDLLARWGRPVGDEEMAEALGVSLARWFAMQQEIHRLVVVGRPREEWNERPAEDPADVEARAGEECETPFEFCCRQEQREILGRALAGLPDRERCVVALYDLQGMTMKKIAGQLRVDESRISQLHSAALRRLRERLRAGVDFSLESAEERSRLPAAAGA